MTHRPNLLTAGERTDALANLAGWADVPGGNGIERRFAFRSFSEAFAFMTRAALVAEKLDHHPDWTNVYDKVHVRLSTHDVGGVTALDIRLADAMNAIAGP